MLSRTIAFTSRSRTPSLGIRRGCPVDVVHRRDNRIGLFVGRRKRLSQRSALGRRLERVGEVLGFVCHETVGDRPDAKRVCWHAVVGNDARAHRNIAAAEDATDDEVARPSARRARTRDMAHRSDGLLRLGGRLAPPHRSASVPEELGHGAAQPGGTFGLLALRERPQHGLTRHALSLRVSRLSTRALWE